MTTRRGMMAVATVALLVGFATGGALGRQSAEADVKAMHDVYYQYFADGRADAIAEEIYHPNHMRFGADGATIATGRDNVEAGMRRSIDGLVAQGYDRSEMMAPSICAPNPGTVIVSGGIRDATTTTVASSASWARPISTARPRTGGGFTPSSATTRRRWWAASSSRSGKPPTPDQVCH